MGHQIIRQPEAGSCDRCNRRASVLIWATDFSDLTVQDGSLVDLSERRTQQLACSRHAEAIQASLFSEYGAAGSEWKRDQPR